MRSWRAGLLAAFLAFATACAPLIQQPGRPPAAFVGAHLEDEAFVSSDGTRLAMTRWTPESEPWAVIIAMHGMNSHAGAFHQAGPYWAQHGILVLAYDQRGFGRNQAQHGVWPGSALMIEDLRVMIALVRARYPNARLAVAAVSMAGSVAIEALSAPDAPLVDRLVLISPGVWGWSQQAPPASSGLWVLGHTARGLQVRPPRWLVGRFEPSDNTEEIAASLSDPYTIWSMRPDSLYGLVALMERASQHIGSVRAPMAYLYGAHDHVIPAHAARAAARHLPADTRTAYYPNGWHWLLLDRQARVVWDDVEAFVRDPAAPWPSGAGPIPR
jgi:alpha-beta hydrolase superfamily lysophospholipase